MNYPIEDPNQIDDTSDEGIRQQICKALQESHIPGEESIEVEVADGVVVLNGDLPEESAHKIEDLVRSVHHVNDLVSNLQPLRM